MEPPIINKLIAIDKALFDDILNTPVQDNNKRGKNFFSEIFADASAKNIKDKLDFQSDVDAIAKVIAYKEVKPPLAIGLFGNWGSGKSFFMNELQQKIEKLKTDKNGLFCKKILSVNFNSWHYSDSNPWASLVTKIFDDLNKYGNQEDQKKEGDVAVLFKNLNSTKELEEEAKEKKKKIDNEIQSLTKQKEVFDQTVTEKSGKLALLSFKEILQGIIKDDVIKKDIENLKSEYSFLDIEDYKG
ncbi:MAG TPA: P-loop NTPase fold protein [Parafilimonas sp.]|nr:P-loop NTPase fold protein [Parafilimonas sp.]